MEKDKEEKKHDKVEDASPEYISAKEIAKKKAESLATIPLPPDSVLKSAFLTAIKYRGKTEALKAYNSSVQALVEIKHSTADFNDAAVRALRSIETLKDAQTIHQSDKNIRDAELLRSEQHLEQMKHKAYLAEKQREVEKHNVNIQHEQLMGAAGTDDLTEEEQEVEEYMRDKLRPSRYASVADKIRRDMNLTDEQSYILDSLVEELTKSVG